MPIQAKAKWITACALLLGLSGSAHADVYLYTDGGNKFNDFVAGSEMPELTSANNVTFSFETNSILGANSEYSISNAIYWQVDDGLDQLDSDDLVIYDALWNFGTNSAGQIVSWFFALDGISAAAGLSMSVESCGPAACLSSIGVSGKYAGDYDQITPLVGSFDYSAVASSPGTWSGPVDVSTIPEPASFLTLSLGVGWLLWGLRARRRGGAVPSQPASACKSAATAAITGSQAPGVG